MGKREIKEEGGSLFEKVLNSFNWFHIPATVTMLLSACLPSQSGHPSWLISSMLVTSMSYLVSKAWMESRLAGFTPLALVITKHVSVFPISVMSPSFMVILQL